MSSQAARVDSLLSALAPREPVAYDLGTPELPETPEVQELVNLGSAIVPHLVALTAGDDARTLAYVALVLGRIGDPRALAPLRTLRERFHAREQKGAWDYAVIGESNIAIEQLARLEPRVK